MVVSADDSMLEYIFAGDDISLNTVDPFWLDMNQEIEIGKMFSMSPRQVRQEFDQTDIWAINILESKKAEAQKSQQTSNDLAAWQQQQMSGGNRG